MRRNLSKGFTMNGVAALRGVSVSFKHVQNLKNKGMEVTAFLRSQMLSLITPTFTRPSLELSVTIDTIRRILI